MLNLTFLNSGILLAALTALIPLLIYLFAKKKPNKVIFSSIRFIKLSQNKQNKKINIKNILLLIIRTLIILLTILAIARPAIKFPFLKSSTRHPKTAIVFIIDNSYSMDNLIDTKTELDIAKDIAIQINGMLSENDVTAILTLDEEWNQLYGNLRYGKIPERSIQSIEITPTNLEVDDVMKDAKNLILESQLPNREIYFISDNQDYEITKLEEIPVFYIPTSEESEKMNISCQNSHLENVIVSKQMKQTISADLVNHTDQVQSDVIYSLFLDGQTRQEKVTDIAESQTKKVSFEINLSETGWHSGYIEVKNERLSFDNRSYFSFYFEMNPQIAVITSSSQIPLPLETLLQIYSNSEKEIKTFDPQTLDYTDIESYDLIVVSENEYFSSKLRFILEKLEKNGKGVIYTTQDFISPEWQDFLGETFSLEFKNYENQNSIQFDYFNKYHPITQIFDTSQMKKNAIKKYWTADADENAEILLQAENNPLILVNNKSILWNFDVSALNNQFFVDSSFPVLAFRCFEYVANRDFSLPSVIVGNSINIDATHVELPTEDELEIKQEYTFPISGVYKFTNNGNDEKLVSVNLNYTESDYTQLKPEDAEGINITNTINWKDQILQSRYGFEIWKILLIIVLILFSLEMFIIKGEERKGE